MGYSVQVNQKARDKMYQRRINAEKEADMRREEIYARLPRVRELEKEIASGGIRAVRAVLGGQSAGEQLEKLKEENLSMQRELKELLAENGYSENVLEPYYSCEKCGDTGFYENSGRTLMCSCMKALLAECACEELNKYAPLSLSTFESFRLDYYSNQPASNGVVPRDLMDRILKFCKQYAENFTTSSGSVLMTGATGLGKTHLSLAIANEVIKRGYGVIYVSAPTMVQKLEKEFRSRSGEESVAETLQSCDLLIIDDLGTEFHTQYSVSQIYNIINSRLLANKPVIISTNMNMAQLEKAYTNRFVSRIFGDAQKLNFIGEDIRIRRRNGI